MLWDRFPQFDKTNTVICDAKQETFAANPGNGILITPYLCTDHGDDEELLRLGAYLKDIVIYDDLSELDHKIWRFEIGSGTVTRSGEEDVD